MMNNMRPSKHLTDLLSTYLDFDGKEIKLGLWGGDLKIQDVHLRNDAFTPLLNSWKDNSSIASNSDDATNVGIDIAAFLTKELLIDHDPSLSSTIDLKLIKGTIGYCRAKIPWQNLLLKNNVETVHIDLRDVTIRLGCESCIAKLLLQHHEKQKSLVGKGQKKRSGKRIFNKLHGNERIWKQEMIRIAEECVSSGKDIPSPAEFATMKDAFLAKLPSDTKFHGAQDGGKATFLERFVKSFATSIGWRVGKGLKVTMRNIRIVIVHGGIEVGLHTDVIELFQYTHSDDDSSTVSMSMDNSSFPSKESDSRHTGATGELEEGDLGDSIRKLVKISNCGLFVREISDQDASTDWSSSSSEVSLDEYVLQPTNVSASLCLRKTGLSVQVDEVDGGKQSSSRVTESTTTSAAEDLLTKKPRRGKKEKKRKLNADAVSVASSVNYVLETSSQNSMQHSVETSANNSQHSFDGIDFAESSALVSTKLKVEGITIVTTTRSLELIRRFLRRLLKLKNGRPCSDFDNFPAGSVKRKRFSQQMLLYSLFTILKDVKRRKILVQYFQMSGAPFVPSPMRPFRQKYIECYTQSRLKQQNSMSTTKGDQDFFNKELQENFIQKMEDTLSVEEVVLYRKMAERPKPNKTASGFERPDLKRLKMKSDSGLRLAESQESLGYSFESDISAGEMPITKPMHMRRRSDGIIKAPKHRRNQTLNIDTMNESLGFIPSSRQGRYATDLSAISEVGSIENDGVKSDLESMLEFDKAMMNYLQSKEEDKTKANIMDRSRNIGSVSSSLTFEISAVKLFVCEQVSGYNQSQMQVDSGSDIDEMSTLTDTSYDYTKSSTGNTGAFNKGLMILGSPHTILFSSVFLKAKFNSYKDLSEESKVKNFCIEGLYCRLRETDVLWSGMVQRSSNKEMTPVSSLTTQPQSIGELCDYQLCRKISTEQPFTRGDVSSAVYKSSSTPCKLNVSFAKIYSFANVSLVKDILNSFGNEKDARPASVEMTEEDDIRFQVAGLLAQENSGFNGSNGLELVMNFTGIEFSYPMSDYHQDLVFDEGAVEDKNLIKLTTGEILLRKGIDGSCASKNKQINEPLTSKSVLTYRDLKLSYCNHIALFETPLSGELALSTSITSTGVVFKPVKNLKFLLSPVSIVLSQDLLRTISSGLEQIEETRSSSNSSPSQYMMPRLSVLAGFQELKLQLHLESFRLAVTNGNPSTGDIKTDTSSIQLQRAAFGEILSDVLSYLACFPPPYSASAPSEAKTIALGRMNAIGLTSDEAERCMVFAIEHFIQKLDAMGLDSALSQNKNVVNIVGLSQGRVMAKLQSRKVGEIESFLDHLIKMTVDETHAYRWKLESDDIPELTKALLLDIPSSIQLDAERYFYDWKITGHVKSFDLRNGGGRQLSSLSCAVPGKDGNTQKVGLLFTVIQKDEKFALGKGGLSLNSLSNRAEIYSLDKAPEIAIQASVGSFQVQFSDLDWTSAAETLSVLTDGFAEFRNEEDHKVENREVFFTHTSVAASVDVSSCQVLLCTDDFHPFSKAVFDNLSADIVSNAKLLRENKNMQILAKGDSIMLYDLTPEGQTYEEVLVPLKCRESSEACFELRMIISSDARLCPSELLVVCTSVRTLLLRRFLNELLQYFLSPQYGIGHFLSIHTNPNLEGDTHPHPMSFQICLMESSLVCPKNSRSDELVAFESQKIILTSSYERESFATPSPSSFEASPVDETLNDAQEFDGKGMMYQHQTDFFDYIDLESESFLYNDSKDSEIEFDPNSIFRIIVSAENVRIFTGISQDRFEQGLHEDLFYVAQHLEIQRARPGDEVFRNVGSLPEGLFSKKKRVSELCKRIWEEITLDPVQLEVIADYTSSGLRIFMKDQITFDNEDHGEPTPFNIQLRMSQFYSLLSLWYDNMQELPVLFPYSIQSIFEAVEEPECPKNWPEYGSESYVDKVCSDDDKGFEIFVSFVKLHWRCSFDPPGYFSKALGCAYMLDTASDTISFEAEGLLLKTDYDDENVMRAGCVSKSLTIQDSRKSTEFEQIFHILPLNSDQSTGHLNMAWGLGRNVVDFTTDLEMPFQFSLYMTPDRWCLANIGMVGLETSSHDLAFFWILLEYFSSYFVSDSFGNPYFEAERKRVEYLNQFSQNRENSSQMPCLNMDVRLWLANPRLAIPAHIDNSNSQALVLKSEAGGIFYRYKTVDFGFYSQSIISQNMDILFLSDAYSLGTDVRKIKKSDRSTQMIAASLNLNIQYDMHVDTNHMNMFISSSIPDPSCDEKIGIESSHANVEPLLLPPPTICHPRFKFSKRKSSFFSCDVTLSPEDLQMAWNLLYNFSGPYEVVDDVATISSSGGASKGNDQKNDLSMSATVKLSGIRLVICEPILGMHLPIANIYLSELRCSLSDFKFRESFTRENLDFQGCADAQLWVDYYKSGPTRSWEPLLEPYKCTVLYEKSSRRGLGVTVNSETPFHLNISGAFLETFDFARSSFFTSIFKILGKESSPISSPCSIEKKENANRSSGQLYFSQTVKENLTSVNGEALTVMHEKMPTLSSEELVAYSLINLTGERLRFHQQNRPKSNLVIGYLDNLNVTALSFPATKSVFRNLKVVEVSSEGTDDGEVKSGGKIDSSHYIDVQVPGMFWSRSISVDNPGKRFVNLSPRSGTIMAKIQSDWRLANILCLLTEVSTFEGGRQVTFSSPVEVVNKTNHNLSLAFHTDPSHFDKISSDEHQGETHKTSETGSDSHVVHPDETYQVSILLMQAALESQGKNLGCFWVRPKETHVLDLLNSLRGKESVQSSNASIGFCSRPVDILNLVKESSELFKEESCSQTDMNTEYHLFCPIIEESKELISPFCYCVEVKRTPVVSPFPGHGVASPSSNDTVKSRSSKELEMGLESLPGENSSSGKKRKQYSPDGTTSIPHRHIHGPVAYSLVIHPPIVIENLLPEPARYEIMHGTKRKVVWWSDLKPGESIPIHTVGLDSPLFLMVNVGYCRTPVGEGALIHHGSDIIKRVQGQDKLLNSLRRTQSENSLNEENAYSENKGDDDDILPAETPISYDFVATCTTVVDSIGQKLNLCIDNKKGAGGQRHITVSCPYWIVNTTEYPLQYKQEKSGHLVSGSIKSATKDGSKPVDSSKRNAICDHGFHKTIFAGRPGALFGAKKTMNMHEYTTLLGTDIPLDQLAKLAFMFNYGESHRFGANERLCLKLVDPLWRSDRCSEWSRGFSLESVGVTQVVGMHCVDGRQLEVAAVVTLAEGVLSKYTKIVRICPRYVLINQLTRPIRLWQDSSLVHPSRVLDSSKDISRGRENPNWRQKPSLSENSSITIKGDEIALCQYDFLFGQPTLLDYQPGTNMPNKTVAHESAVYITTSSYNDPIPFHLPDTRADRELRIDLGPNWNLSASFPADVISDHTLKMTRVVDLRLLKHVDNRGASKYKVQLPPTDTSGSNLDFDGELGLWFETIQWNGSSKCIVKGTKRDKFSYNNTDIHVGDELLSIDGKPVSKMEFSETMKLLKERLSDVADACKLKRFKNQKFPRSAQKGRKPKFLKRFDRSYAQGGMGSIAESVGTEDTDSDVEIIGGPKDSLTLEFQTLEYRMKKVRDRALKRRKHGVANRKKYESEDQELMKPDKEATKFSHRNASDASDHHKRVDTMQIEVSTQLINQSAFIFVNELNSVTPYRIENRSMKKFVHFRQRDCENHPWNALAPGESVDYTWEEPLKPSKLVVRVGNQGVPIATKDKTDLSNVFNFKKVASEDQGGFGPSKIVKLDEVGLEGVLPCSDGGHQRDNANLLCNVDTDGATRVLVISDTNTSQSSYDGNDSSRWTRDLSSLQSHRNILTKEIEAEQTFLRAWKDRKLKLEKDLAMAEGESLSNFSSQLLPTVQEDTEASPSNDHAVKVGEFETHIDHYEDTIITRNHQVIVEVIEASGLQSAKNSALIGLCSPYCSVRLEDGSKSMRRNVFTEESNVERTYFIERCSSPKWTGMKFVFDVPASAVSDPHGFAVLVKVKDRRIIGRDRPLGRTEIHLRNLRNQKEVIGWFPLLSRTGKGSDLANPAAAGRVQGSVKLRAQWIYTLPALLDYYILLSESRLIELRANRDSITKYYDKMKEEAQKQKDLYDLVFDMKSLSGWTTPNFKNTNLQLKSSDGRWTSALKQTIRPQKLRNLWKRQQPSMDTMAVVEHESDRGVQSRSGGLEIAKLNIDMSVDDLWSSQLTDTVISGDHLQLLKSPLPIKRGIAFSEGDILSDKNFFDASISPRVVRDLAEQNPGILETLRFSNILKRDSSVFFHHIHMENMIFANDNMIASETLQTNLISWVSAYGILNDVELQAYFIPPSELRSKKSGNIHIPTVASRNAPYKSLSLPERATAFMKEQNINFRKKLLASREHFDKAAQRSLMAVLNPGGWLKLRPITALCLHEEKDNKFTGMFVRVRYGSKSRSTSTVDATVTPTWTDDCDVLDDSTHEANFFERRDNDLEVKIEPLKTSVALQLSVFGTRMNTKVELGVLQIPLAHAISCCTESSENIKKDGSDHKRGIYVRWFPLKDPKDCVGGDGQVCYRPTDIEQTSDDKFSNYMTPCIKLAMWWDPDTPKKVKESKALDDQQSLSQESANINRNSHGDQTFRLLPQRYFHASIDSISAAFIDSFKARELLSLTTSDTDIRYSHTKSTTQVGMAMAHLQLDHHDEKALEPVILYPRPVPNPQPTIQFLAIKNNIRSKSNLDSFKHIAIALEEMDLRIEETWMFDVWEFFGRFLRRRRDIEKKSVLRSSPTKQSIHRTISTSFVDANNQEQNNEVLDMMNSRHQHAVGKDEQRTKQIYIEKLMLAPVKFNISYIKSSRTNENVLQNISIGLGIPGQQSSHGTTVAHEVNNDPLKFEIFRQWSESGHDEEWATTVDERTQHFQNVISAAFPGITDAPIRVNGKVLDNLFKTWGSIIADLQNYYLKEMMFQIYKILGSVDFFGNPVMAVNSIMKGAHDFVVLPFREFIRSPNNPSKLGIGVAKGTLSFLSHLFSGIFGFVSNISEAGGTAAAALSFDEHFKRWHKQQVADHFRHMHGQFRPKGGELIMTAITRPLQDVVAGLLFAASGVFVEPYKGAQLKGMAGFTKGLGVGTVGLVAKPLVGVFDAFAHVSESMHDFSRSANVLVKNLNSVKKMRLPYVFGLHKILLPYNSVDACSANLLRLFPLKREKRSQSEDGEVLILSQLLQRGPGLGWYIVVTTKRIVKFIVRYDGTEPPVMNWQIEVNKKADIISRVEHCSHSEVLLEIKMLPYASNMSPVKNQAHSRKPVDKSREEEQVPKSINESTNMTETENFLTRNMKTNPVQNALGAFGNNRNRKRERTTYYVPGDLQSERDALIQVHNAICCLTGRFKAVMSRTYTNSGNTRGDMEGLTSFGPLHFEEESENKATPESSENDISDYLDTIPWMYRFGKSFKTRNKWDFSDELVASQAIGGGPDWFVEARARATFQPPTNSSLPSIVDDFEVHWHAANMPRGKLSHIDTISEPNALNYSEKQADIDFDGTRRAAVTGVDSSLIFGDEGHGQIESSKETTMEDRLENVEYMLHRLMQRQVHLEASSGVASEPNFTTPNSTELPTSNVSTVSALTEHIPIHTTHLTNQLSTIDETNQLRREVELLRMQLAETERISHSRDQPKKKGRFKKLWKSSKMSK